MGWWTDVWFLQGTNGLIGDLSLYKNANLVLSAVTMCVDAGE